MAEENNNKLVAWVRRRPFGALLLVSLLSVLAWRLEVAYHGSYGLGWLFYFHWALPFGLLLFLLWANAIISVRGSRRLWVNVIALLFACLVYAALNVSLSILFSRNFLFLLFMGEMSEMEFMIYKLCVLFVIPMIPCFTYLILRFTICRAAFKYAVFSILAMYAAIPLALLLLMLPQARHADLIHTIKSGALLGLWMTALGLVPLGFYKARSLQA